jgi:hypothetical protein
VWGRAEKLTMCRHLRDEPNILYLHVEDAHVLGRGCGWVACTSTRVHWTVPSAIFFGSEVIVERAQRAHDATLSVCIINDNHEQCDRRLSLPNG